MIVAGSASPLLLASAGGYNLTNSLRFRSSASAYLNRTPASAGNRRTWTWSGWVKRGVSVQFGGLFTAWSANNASGYAVIRFDNDQLLYKDWDTVYRQTSQVFRDFSAWYHIVVAIDTTQATASNRVKMYVNGVQVTAFATSNDITQNSDTNVNNTVLHTLGVNYFSSAPQYFTDGYLAEVNFIDGQALTPSSFGETSTTTGVWIPKEYTGTYGTNGFYLPFTDTTSTSTLGTDFSGNSNTWTVNNISLTAGSTYDSMTDVPTLTDITTANYCVLSPIDTYDNPPTEGNLARIGVGHTGSPWSTCRSTLGVSSGKWYFEGTFTGSTGSAGNNMIGVMTTTTSTLNDAYGGSTTRSYQANGNLQGDNSTGTVSSAVSGDVIMIAFDVDAGKLWVGKNGTWMNSGVPASGTGNVFTTLPTSPIVPQVSMYGNTGDNYGWFTNFGQRPFAYTPPAGFVALNTFNLPAPPSGIGTTAAELANEYFDVNLYTGNGAIYPSSQSITGLQFQPDFTWIKSRSNGYPHFVFDAVRGAGKELVTNDTAVETNKNQLSAFNSNGFSVAVATDGSLGTNGNGSTFVAWNWRASNTTPVSNTAGSITSTVSASTTAGFSIVTYSGNGTSGATVGHGLGVKPAMVIIKGRNASTGASEWVTQHQSLSGGVSASSSTFTLSSYTSVVYLSGTYAAGAYGFDAQINGASGTYVAYCFAEVAGYSAFGSYTGNGVADGPFIFTGFRPRYFILKNITSAQSWSVQDTSRSPYNVGSAVLLPNSSSAELTGTDFIDIVSNGFKIRHSSSGNNNNNGDTYIYMAFCESPFKFANAR